MPPRDCCGREPNRPCRFRLDGSGGPARPPRGRDRCAFCDRDYMTSLCVDQEQATRVLQKLKGFPEDVQQKGIEIIPDGQKEWFQEKLAKIKRCAGLDGEPCVFDLSGKGMRSRVSSHCAACVLCDKDKIAQMCTNSEERHKLKVLISKMCSASMQKIIAERIPAEHRPHFADLLPGDDSPALPPPDASPRARARKRPASQTLDQAPAEMPAIEGPGQD